MENKALRTYILVPLLVIYIFFSDVIISLTEWYFLKPLIAVIFTIFFTLFIAFGSAIIRDKVYVILPSFLILIYLLVWNQIGYLNLIYTPVFAWLLSRDMKLTLQVFKVIIVIQFLLVFYERLFAHLIYDSVETGVFVITNHDYGKNIGLFDLTGFRPKGLFNGTLVASSFAIYMSMIFRNNSKILFFLVVMALVVNGRLAILVTLATYGLNLIKRYKIICNGKALGPLLKIVALSVPFFTSILIILVSLPDNIVNNYLNVFNTSATANAGRIYAYGEALLLLSNYSVVEFFFGRPGNAVYDIYGRLVASESGLLSMALDIGFIGLFFYLLAFIRLWLKNKNGVLAIRHKEISLKFVAIVNFLCWVQYEHINGNVRGTLFWVLVISVLTAQNSTKQVQ